MILRRENGQKPQVTRMDPSNRMLAREAIGIFLPPALTLVLFLVTLFAVFVPHLEKALWNQKKVQISNEVQTVWSILQYYERSAKAGEFPRETAQELAKDHLRSIRYGDDGKDYFWINDMGPVMIMHPFRPELEGRNVSAVSDPEGKLMFQEIVDTVKEGGSGYVAYAWQWKDDPNRIVPKISYVKSFSPWGWIVGTGVYVEDIREEIDRLKKQILLASAVIFFGIVLLALLIVRNLLRVWAQRVEAEKELNEYKDQLEDLVEQRTAELKEAMSKVKILGGFLPICASCKKIRDDKGYWNQIESYIREHSEAEFSHALCPECAKRLYPDIYTDDVT